MHKFLLWYQRYQALVEIVTPGFFSCCRKNYCCFLFCLIYLFCLLSFFVLVFVSVCLIYFCLTSSTNKHSFSSDATDVRRWMWCGDVIRYFSHSKDGRKSTCLLGRTKVYFDQCENYEARHNSYRQWKKVSFYHSEYISSQNCSIGPSDQLIYSKVLSDHPDLLIRSTV